ncbi:MAG: hypothetical protein ACE5G6_03370 [Terriglobia bacterium]
MRNKAREILHSEIGVFAAIRLCLQKKCISSAIALAYSAIDVLSWLAMPANKFEVTRQDFISWADQYVVPGSSLDCSGTDLYGARCGIVHTLTPVSRMSQEGRAMPIAYSWGNQPPYRREHLERLGVQWLMLHVETLCDAVEQGASRFWDEVEKDNARLDLINKRADLLIRPAPELPPDLSPFV